MKKGLKRKQEIVQTSLKLIAEGGTQNFTTRKVCRELGLSDSAMYRHYSCKADILSDILTGFENQFDEIINDISKCQLTPAEKLKEFFLRRIEKLADNPDIAKVIFSEEIFQHEKILSEKVQAIMKKNQKEIGKIIHQGIDDGSFRADLPPMHLCMMILGSLRLLVTRWRMAEYRFDMKAEGANIWNSFETIIVKET